MKKNILTRIKMSKDGAIIMFFAYSIIILGLSIFKISYYNLSAILQFLIVPGSIIVSVTSASDSTILGIPFITLFVSMLIYMAIGYTFDWFYKPYE